MGKRIIILVIFILNFWPGKAGARDWYVDNAATGANNGTSWANAWTSLTSVNGTAPGDMVYISGGSSSKTYTGLASWQPAPGAANNPVTYKVGQDAGHNGKVIFDGNGAQNWLYGGATKVRRWITVDGNYNGENHIEVKNYNLMLYADDGAFNVTLRYITSKCKIRCYHSNYMDLDHLILGPTMGIDGIITGMGIGGDVSQNHIRNCTLYAYYQHGANQYGGNGDDYIQNISGVTVSNCNFISVYTANYTRNQHQDGIQCGGNVRVEGCYFENIANYAFFGELWGNGGNMQLINNVINYSDPVLTSQPSCGIAIGGSGGSAGVIISNVVVANNTLIGGNRGISLEGGKTNGLSNCHVVNNLLHGTHIDRHGLSGVTYSNNITTGLANVFMDLAGKDFHLRPTATGIIDAGTSWPASYFSTDKDGTPRPQGTGWDIGAYEYKASVICTDQYPISNVQYPMSNVKLQYGIYDLRGRKINWTDSKSGIYFYHAGNRVLKKIVVN